MARLVSFPAWINSGACLSNPGVTPTHGTAARAWLAAQPERMNSLGTSINICLSVLGGSSFNQAVFAGNVKS